MKKTHYNYGFFANKKKYFLFDDKPICKGFDTNSNFYANKQRRNLAYNISGFNDTIKKFNNRNCKKYDHYLTKASTILNRTLKLNQIINIT